MGEVEGGFVMGFIVATVVAGLFSGFSAGMVLFYISASGKLIVRAMEHGTN